MLLGSTGLALPGQVMLSQPRLLLPRPVLGTLCSTRGLSFVLLLVSILLVDLLPPVRVCPLVFELLFVLSEALFLALDLLLPTHPRFGGRGSRA